MKLNRGDVVMTRFPHASGVRGKKRPALVVQADVYNSKFGHVLARFYAIQSLRRSVTAGSVFFGRTA
jgi:mRNA-degrading endonuclease toxin of MazEF toxin-antitoxin module